MSTEDGPGGEQRDRPTDAGPSRPRGAGTRSALLAAAAAVVAEQGWRNATARAVARRAEVPLGAVSYHFASKEDLLRDAVLAEFAALFAAPAAALEAARTVEDAVRAQVAWLTDDVRPDRRRFLLEVLLEGTRDPQLGGVLGAALQEWRDGLAAALRRLAPQVEDPAAAAAALTATLSGQLVHAVVEDAFPLADAARALVGVWHAGLEGTGPAGAAP